MSSLIQQRRAMYEQKMQDDYPDFVFGVGLGAIILERCLVATPFIEIPATCASITIHFSNTASKGLYNVRQQLYNTNKGWGYSYTQTNYNSDYTFTITAGQYAYIRVTLDCDYLDEAYIKDNTNNAYLWKGKNVV